MRNITAFLFTCVTSVVFAQDSITWHGDVALAPWVTFSGVKSCCHDDKLRLELQRWPGNGV